jgi:alpha-tubulin suppressor-like RCC1 family protein
MNVESNGSFAWWVLRGGNGRASARRRCAGRTAAFVALLLTLLGCSAGSEQEELGKTTAAVISSASLTLKVLTNSCGLNQVQDFFQITNTGTASIALSDLTVKLWVNDTSTSNMTASISTGGCLTNGSGCFHQVTGSSASVTPFSPACGPDSSHLADREITLATSDHTLLAPGQSWTNLQAALRLASSANFKPGTSTWYSPCLSGTQYKADPHFALYYKGNIVFASGVTAPSCRGPQGTQKLTGYVPSELSSAPLVGPLAPSTVLHFGVGLPVQNATALDSFVKQVSDPNSPSYRQYLTPDQFTTTYGPTQAAFQAVVTWANANGLTVDNPGSTSRLFVEVHGTAANVEKAVYANFVQRTRSDGTTFYMLDREPSLDLSPSVLRISGLDNFKTSKAAYASFGTGSFGAYLGRDFRAYYAGCTANTGSGQRVGVFAADGFHPEDIADYAAADGLSAAPLVTAVPLDGYDGTPRGDGNDEVELDIQMVMGMAPGVDEIVVFETDPEDPNESTLKGANSTLDRMTSRMPLMNQLTSSFDFPIDDNTQQYLNKAVAQGQSFFEVSGDTGSDGYSSNQNGEINTRWGVTLVGGTILNGTALENASEVAWAGSGGGLLFSTDIPDYQVGIDMSQNGGSTTDRNVPDVAMNAWNAEQFENAGDLVNKEGTSVSTPLWAGYMALINQQAAKNGNPPLGFLNPLVYDIGQSSGLYGSTFNDITSGNNGAFDAVTGYDLVTGWGSPKCSLITQLGQSKPLLPLRIGISTNNNDACAIGSDGTVECWGSNQYGKVGTGTTDAVVATPHVVAGIGPVVDVSVGWSHSCAVTQGAKVMCWGNNERGELGDGTRNNSSTPVEAQGLTDAISVSAGVDHTCAVRSNGTVVCWGNDETRPGPGTGGDNLTPTPVAGLTGILNVSCGGFFTCVRDSAENVECWGDNYRGKLGDGNDESEEGSRHTPAPVVNLESVEALSLSEDYACAIVFGGTVWCWGEGQEDMFGDDGADTPTPVKVAGVSGATQISTGQFHACVTLEDGSAMCGGSNSAGELGHGTQSEAETFSEVQGLSDVVKIETGLGYSCAMTSNGRAYCWGQNTQGVLGLGLPDSVPPVILSPTELTF